jgi:PKD repeat protein
VRWSWCVVLVTLLVSCTKSSPTAPAETPAPPPAGTAAAIFISPNSFDLPAGGGSLELVIATSANDVGNVVAPNVPLTLSASSGELSNTEPRTDSTGHARVTWTGNSSATITARAGDAVGASTIRVAGGPPNPPPPNPNPNPNPGPNPNPNPGPTPNPNPTPTPPTPDNGVRVFWSVSPAAPVAGEPVTFSATVTSRPDAAVASYAWDFTEDGVTDDTSATPTHTFDSEGRKGVRVTVTLVDGRTASDAGGLTVTAAPTPTITTTLSATPTSVAPGDTVTLTATATPNRTSGAVTSYDWDFDNNNTVDQTTAGPSTTTTYSTIGTKTAKVTAKSAKASGSATATVAVSAPPLTISKFTADPATAGSPVTFHLKVDSASLPASATFAWDYENDGLTNETTTGDPHVEIVIQHIYNEKKTFTIKVTVTAPDGRTVSGTAQVTIS